MVAPPSTYDGLDQRALARLVGAPAVTIRTVVNSTFDIAHQLGQGGALSGTLVLAEEQTGGRGRQGRTWESPRGGGIWMSLILRPKVAPTGGALAIRAGLATVDALATAAPGLEPRLKWPNDVMVQNAKVAGVLCEARWTGDALAWIAVGIGINVHGPVELPGGAAAIAVGDVVPGIKRTAILAELIPRLTPLADAGALLSDGEVARFMAVVWRPRGETITGIAHDGALLIRGAGGEIARRTDAG